MRKAGILVSIILVVSLMASLGTVDVSAQDAASEEHPVLSFIGSLPLIDRLGIFNWSDEKELEEEIKASPVVDTPKLKKTLVDTNGILVKWNSVSDADGYAIFRRKSGEAWERIGTTTDTSYTDKKGGSSGTIYDYTVRAYQGEKEEALAHAYEKEYWSDADPDGVSGSAYEIAGKSGVTVQQMVDFYEKYSPIDYPKKALGEGGAPTIEDLAQDYYDECEAEGIKAEVAFCQMILETGYLAYGGDVKISQFNFAGLGATGGGAAGASFDSVKEGVRAQVQHLKAYTSSKVTEKDLAHPVVDPRFDLVSKGSAKYVEILGAGANPKGKGWAVGKNSKDYGPKILELIEEVKAM